MTNLGLPFLFFHWQLYDIQLISHWRSQGPWSLSIKKVPPNTPLYPKVFVGPMSWCLKSCLLGSLWHFILAQESAISQCCIIQSIASGPSSQVSRPFFKYIHAFYLFSSSCQVSSFEKHFSREHGEYSNWLLRCLGFFLINSKFIFQVYFTTVYSVQG